MPTDDAPPTRVVIAGGGIAALEALLALRDLAGTRVELTLLAPGEDFVHRPLAVTEPFGLGRPQRVPLAGIAQSFGARLVAEALERVDEAAGMAVTSGGDRLPFDALLVATGARAEPALAPALTWWAESDPSLLAGVLDDLAQGRARRIAFVVPAPAAWPLPAYELALLTRRAAEAAGVEAEIIVVTPEEQPLGLFGTAATAAVGADLAAAGIAVRTGAYAERVTRGRPFTLALAPGGDALEADHVVALPRVGGPRIAGLPADPAGFLPITSHCQVAGCARVWAAGDGTSFPLKQGGIATQQADAAAADIAALAGAGNRPEPFRPVLRGILLTGARPRFLKQEAAGGGGEGLTGEARLWWPPTKVAGRYLAPYLAARDPSVIIDPRPATLPETAVEVVAPLEPAGGT